MNTSTMSNHIIFIHDFYLQHLACNKLFYWWNLILYTMGITYNTWKTFTEDDVLHLARQSSKWSDTEPRAMSSPSLAFVRIFCSSGLWGENINVIHIINSRLTSWSREQLNKAKLRISRFKTKTWYKSYFLSMK